MELVEIDVGYDYQVRGRQVGLRTERWMILRASTQAVVPQVSADEAPEAGVLAYPSGYRERYRTYDGRLYRQVTAPADPARPRQEPLRLADALRAGPLRIGNVGKIPWRWLEKGAGPLYEGPDVRRNGKGEIIAEIFENRIDRSLARVAGEARDAVLVVDGVLHVASEPPMIAVHAHGNTVDMISGAEMESSDPLFSLFGNNQTTLFTVDRVEDAAAFSAEMEEHWTVEAARMHGVDVEHFRARVREGQVGARGHRLGRLEIVPGFEPLFLVDEMIAGARRNISFLCSSLAEYVPDMDSRGIAAFAAMREAVSALERPEGRTRANARAAFEAVRAMAAAEPGGWGGETTAMEGLEVVRRYARHLCERYRTDPRFAPGPDEILEPEDEAAMRGLEAAP